MSSTWRPSTPADIHQLGPRSCTTERSVATLTKEALTEEHEEPNYQSSRTSRYMWKAKHAKSVPATTATERVAKTRLWHSAKYTAVRKETRPPQRLEEHPRGTRRRRAGADPTALWTHMSSRIPGATEPRGDTKERRSAQGPAQLRDIRDVRRTAQRGDVSLREILDFARWHECGVKTLTKYQMMSLMSWLAYTKKSSGLRFGMKLGSCEVE